jgi:1-acyl-sn-glycerol-3-phosphate acyltransferase
LWLRGSIAFVMAWLFSIVLWTAFLLFSLITLRRFALDMLAPVAHFWARCILWIINVRVIFENACPYNFAEGRMVIINHPSTLDVIWGALITPPRAFAVGKKELIYIPIINIGWWALGYARIDRSHASSAYATLVELAPRIKREKLSVMMAPEGTRSRDGAFHAFKKGPFRLAMWAGVRIYPVVATGAFEVMPRHRLIPFPGTLRIRFLEPVDVAQWTPETMQQHLEDVHRSMEKAIEDVCNRAADTT